MGRFNVTEAKERALIRWMEELGISEHDLRERFTVGSGSGGQKRNKTSNCVQLSHEPSGIEIRCESSRSQSLNRYRARVELCEKVEQRIRGEESKRAREISKKRRQKQKRSKRSKAKILDAKRKQGEKKSTRKKVSPAS
ncbi:MAG: peptide chain release factor-like protein [Bdellovibrionales bacterium]|nr:peptide chain release factor-like protein [Bdellovibrionales bacterium]